MINCKFSDVLERDMDLLFLEELASSVEFLNIFLSKIGLENADIIEVEQSKVDMEYGESDMTLIVEKDNKNKLKTVPKHLIVNVYFYSVAVGSIFQLLVNLVKVVFFPHYEFSTLPTYLYEFGTMFTVTTIMILLFALSLYSSKKFINACLVKVNKAKD